MSKYIDLNNLIIQETKNNEEIIAKNAVLNITDNISLKNLAVLVENTIHDTLKNLQENKTYNFIFNIFDFGPKELNEEEFETIVNVTLSSFFRNIKINKGRNRERRLDVPDNLKTQVNCNMSLIKNAINYQTLINKFQIEMYNHNLHFILVGDPNE